MSGYRIKPGKGISAVYGYNALSDRGVSLMDIDAPTPASPRQGTPREPDSEERLRKLDALHRDGLITDTEYQEKRAGILAERW